MRINLSLPSTSTREFPHVKGSRIITTIANHSLHSPLFLLAIKRRQEDLPEDKLKDDYSSLSREHRRRQRPKDFKQKRLVTRSQPVSDFFYLTKRISPTISSSPTDSELLFNLPRRLARRQQDIKELS